MINNLEQIGNLMAFDSVDEFYHLQILKRKKEHPELGANSEVVKTYYIRSLAHLTMKMDQIKTICDHENARACINLNRRSFEKVAFHTLRKITDQIMNKDFMSVRKAYESVCGAHPQEPNKKWIVDIDEKDLQKVQIIRNTIKNCEPDRRQDKVWNILETKNGYHIISSPFNRQDFKQFHPEIEVHCDNPTILYIP